jgi:peptidoglycan/LPS O-acetylase OafA/YrhL
MRVHFKPKTKLGKRSAWLLVTLAALMGIFRVNILLGQQGGDTFFSNPSLAIPILLAGISGIAAFITGLISIIRKKERSISVYLAVAIGLIVLIVAFANIISPY